MGKCNEDDLEWTETDPDRGSAHFRRKQLGEAAGSDDLGCSLYELPPGERSWPYHYHTGNEEAIYVLAGDGLVRLAGEERSLVPGDYVALPTDETGAHRVVNDGDEPLRYLVLSTMNEPDAIVYPDSGKVGVKAGGPPGRQAGRTLDANFRLDDTVDYWEGERDAE